MKDIESLKRLLTENSKSNKESVQKILDDFLTPIFGNQFTITRSCDGCYSISYGRHVFVTDGTPNPKIHKVK